MTGLDDEEYGPDEFRAAPHPDDRLWRHPAEIAAMRAAHASAETAKVPVVTLDNLPPRRRTHIGLLAAASVVVIGATAVTLGVMSTRNTPPRSAAVQSSVVTDVGVAALAADSSEDALATTLHAELEMSLPRIQAATADGMREGGGLFVTPTGHIVTSAGLIDGAEYVLVWTADGRRWEASVVAADSVSDVAVVQIDSDDWPAATIGVDRALRSGQYALAIDYDTNTMSIGEIGSLLDTIEVASGSAATRIAVDQLTALPGSAIIDDAGFVIAMATSGRGSMATPAWMVERVALDLITQGRTFHPWLGIAVDDSTDAMIDSVTTGSPAYSAGLRVGDSLESVNGQSISEEHTLWAAIEASSPGDDVEIGFSRGGETQIVEITLDALSD